MSALSASSRGRPEWAWFWSWVAVGALGALAAISLGPLGLLAAAVLVVLLLTRPGARRSAFGALSGAGFLLLYVAYVNREGPKTTCWHTATASGCDQHLDPRPWLVLGLVLIVAGLVAHSRALRPRD